MKKVFFAFLTLFFAVAVFAQTKQPQISWEKTSHDFGVFKEEAGLQTAVFEFTNVGGEPLVLTNVKASCGCTATDYTKEPIPQGKKGFVKASYNPQNRPGRFNKSITVTTNCEAPTTILTISGEVTPREKGVEDYYPKDFGGLRLKTAHLALNNVLNTEVKTDTIGVVNMTDAPMKVTFQNVPKHMTIKMVPATLAAKKANDKMGQEGNIIVTYDGKQKGDWGFLQDRISVVVNDSVNSKNKITVSATIVEDFSHLSPTELANAPKIVFEQTEYDFGTIKQGDKVTYQYKFKNEGKSDLIIRKVKATCGCTVPNPEKMVIKPGEESFIKATFNSAGKKGHQSKPITITTNDPTNSSMVVKIVGNIEDANTVVENNNDNSKNTTKENSVAAENLSQKVPVELPNEPKIVFERTEYDFGTIKKGNKVACEFKFKNEGKNDLIISKVKASSGCSVSKLEKMVFETGEESVIKATLNSAGKKGYQSKLITITTNDPTNSSMVVKIVGNIE